MDPYSILGVSRDATEQEIRTAHKRAMRSAHPDTGGSTAEAQMVNQALDQALANLKQRPPSAPRRSQAPFGDFGDPGRFSSPFNDAGRYLWDEYMRKYASPSATFPPKSSSQPRPPKATMPDSDEWLEQLADCDRRCTEAYVARGKQRAKLMKKHRKVLHELSRHPDAAKYEAEIRDFQARGAVIDDAFATTLSKIALEKSALLLKYT